MDGPVKVLKQGSDENTRLPLLPKNCSKKRLHVEDYFLTQATDVQ